MRRRSFRKLNKKYPLTKFFGFMAGPQGLSINVSWHYVTEIRKMLGWMVSRQIEAKTEEEKKQWGVTGWMAFENVLDYFQTLSTTEARWFQAAWNQWLGFAGDLATPLRSLSLGKNLRCAPLSEALRILLKDSASVPVAVLRDADLAEISLLKWWKDEETGRWTVRSSKDGESLWGLFFEPALRTVREWSYPMKPGKKETCYPGAPFVPLRPLHDAAMPGRRIARILRDRWDDTVKKQLLDEISELKRAANLATIHPSVLQDMKVEKKLVVRPIVLRPMDIGEVEEEGGGEEHFSIERKHRAPTSDLTPDRLSPREQSELAMAKVRADCAKADAEAEEELRGTGISAAEVEEALRREKLGVEGLPVDDEL